MRYLELVFRHVYNRDKGKIPQLPLPVACAVTFTMPRVGRYFATLYFTDEIYWVGIGR